MVLQWSHVFIFLRSSYLDSGACSEQDLCRKTFYYDTQDHHMHPAPGDSFTGFKHGFSGSAANGADRRDAYPENSIAADRWPAVSL